MAKISTYNNASPVALTDKVIGTSVGGSPSDATKNFLLSDIQALFNLTTNTLSDVLTAGNTATNNIVLTGNITASGLTTTNNLRITGEIDGQSNVRNSIKINLLNSFADNAAALAGGLLSGDIYRTDGTAAAPLNVAGILMIVV